MFVRWKELVQNCSGLTNWPQRVLFITPPPAFSLTCLLPLLFCQTHAVHKPTVVCKPRGNALSAQLTLKPKEKGSVYEPFPLCSTSKPLYTAPANHQQPPLHVRLHVHRESLFLTETPSCSHCLQQTGLGVACTETLACLQCVLLAKLTKLQKGFQCLLQQQE